jgi:hypothetical protein
MGRKSKLAPEQWADVDRRLAAGEAPSALAREFDVHPSQITRRKVCAKPQDVRKVAEQLAAAQTALAELPVNQQYTAVTLAEKLRSISRDLAGAAAYGADTARRLKERANAEAIKQLAKPEVDVSGMQLVSGLTKLANESASIAQSLLAGGDRGTLKQIQMLEQDTPDQPDKDDDVVTPTFNITLTTK